jgi:hypothetical protein
MRPVLSLADLEAFDSHPQGRDPEKVFRCPICASDERALHVNTATGAFNCKRGSCGATGKLTDFWQERPKQNRKQRARKALHAAFSLAPKDCSPTAVRTPQGGTEREESAPTTAATWQAHWNGAQPIASTPSAVKYLARRGIPEAIAEAAGVRALNLYGRTYAAFPFHDRDGAAVAFQARALDSEPDGHRAYGRKGAGVFSTSQGALKSETVIITEAPIDALSLAACGFEAIALGGTAAPGWIPAALAFKRVLLAFDNDANGAGDKAAATLAPSLQSFGAGVTRLAPPRETDVDKSDWNAMLLQHGPTELRAWLKARLASLNYYSGMSGK